MRVVRVVLPLLPLLSPLGCGASDADAILSDELSMPREPTLSLASFTSAEQCGGCHVTHYEEWRASSHAYAMVDPVYRALVAVRQEHFGGRHDMFCVQCHSPIGTRGGDITPGFEFADLEPITLEGVTCESCHKVASLVRPYNSGHVLDPEGPVRATIAEPSVSPVHESQYSPLHGSSAFCAGCHDVREVSGLVLERPFVEWQASPAAAAGLQCQGCHMPTYEGQAVAGGPVRALHRHTWTGVDVPLADGFVAPEQQAELRARVEGLLRGAASVEVTAAPSLVAGEPLDLLVTVRNDIVAHNFPTGSTFNRQVWVEVIVRDGDGELVFEAGTLDGDGEPRGFAGARPYADPNLLLLSSVLVDESGRPVPYAWRAVAHLSRTIAPLGERSFALRVPTTTAARGPLSVTARVLFRALSPTLLRTLGLDEYAAKLEIHEVSRGATEVELSPP